jgi:hypothetical protein
MVHASSGTPTDLEEKEASWISTCVNELVDGLGDDVRELPAGFFDGLDKLFETLQSGNVITVYEIESNDRYFRVDYILSGMAIAQSICGSTYEWTKADIDEALGKVGEEENMASKASRELSAFLVHAWKPRLEGHGLKSTAPGSVCVLGVEDSTAIGFFSEFCEQNGLKNHKAHTSLFQSAGRSGSGYSDLMAFLGGLTEMSLVHVHGLAPDSAGKPLGAWDGLLLGEGYDLPSPLFFAVTGPLTDLGLVGQFFIDRVRLFRRWEK